MQPWENFRGLSYGNWLVLWNNWLMSEDPDHYRRGAVLFLRGNLDYRPPTENIDYPRFIDQNSFHNRTAKKTIKIFEDTPIFIPVITSCYTLGSEIDGKSLVTEAQVRQHVIEDIERGGQVWATIADRKTHRTAKLVTNLKKFLTESPLFSLVIPEASLLNDRQYMPLKPDVYEAVSCAYCIILTSLPHSSYRLAFGGKGRGDHYINAVYDIIVEPKIHDTVRDISGRTLKSESNIRKSRQPFNC